MNYHFSPETIAQIRQAADIVDIISEIVHLKVTGADHTGLCPFHAEKTPSFHVSRQKGFYKCFGCGEYGDVFQFVMKMRDASFSEAALELAQRYNIPVSIQDDEESKYYKRLAKILDWASYYFQQQLKTEPEQRALKYALSRGVSAESIEKFKIGYAKNSWDDLSKTAIKEGFTKEELIDVGLCNKSQNNDRGYNDRFRDRLIFPIFNINGEVIAFGGRTLSGEEPKYLNSPETPMFHKSKILYGMNFAKKHWRNGHRILIVEGYFDLIIAHQYGFEEAIATLGTSLSTNHIQILQRHTKDVILVYDGDDAGQKASSRSLSPLLKQQIMVHVVALPDKVDPSDFLVEKGSIAFGNLLEHAKDFWDFQISNISRKYNMKEISSQRYAVEEILKVVKEIPDSITQDLALQKVAEIFQISKERLLQQLTPKKIEKNIPNNSVAEQYKQFLALDEKFLIWVLLHYSNFQQFIFENYPVEDFQDESMKKLAQEIAQDLENGIPIAIETIAPRVDPSLSAILIDLHWASYFESGAGNDDAAYGIEHKLQFIQQRLDLIFKGLYKLKHRKRLAYLNQMYKEAHPEDFELKMQIMRDTQLECKKYQQFIKSKPY